MFADVRHLSRFDGTTPGAVLLGVIPDAVGSLDLCCTEPRGTRIKAHAHAARELAKQPADENDRGVLGVCTQTESEAPSHDIQRGKRARDQESDQKHEAVHVAVNETCNALTLEVTLEVLKDVAKDLFDDLQVEIDSENTLRVLKFEKVCWPSFGAVAPVSVVQQVVVVQTLEYAVFRGGLLAVTDKGFIQSVEQWRELLQTLSLM